MFPAIAAVLGGLARGAGGIGGLASGFGGMAGKSVSFLGNAGRAAMGSSSLPFNKPPPVPNATPWQKQIEASERATHAIKEKTHAENELTERMQAGGRALDQISQAFSNIPAKLATPITMVKQFGDNLGAFTALSNPGQFAVFGRVITDAFAALGKGLEPLMGFAIAVGQFVGDTFAKLEPIITTVSKVIAEIGGVFLSVFGGIFKSVFDALTPVFEVFIALANQMAPAFFAMNPVFLVLMGVMKLFAESLMLITWPLRMAIKALQSLGLMAKTINPDASSKGMAAQNFAVSSSADDFQRQMAVSALSSNGPKTAEEATKEMPSILKSIKDEIAKLGEKLPDLLKTAALDLANSMFASFKENNPISQGLKYGSDLGETFRNLAMR